MTTRRHFGSVPEILEGQDFESRRALHDAGVHLPTQAGISGSGGQGADSIVLSGGYEDDQDEGDVIVYTGQGGRDPVIGKQVAHQTLTLGNLALALSHQEGFPVRVTRGHQHRSPYSPISGYRYGGLYRVEDHWHELGKSGYRIWRYRLVKQGVDPASAAPKDSAVGRKEVTIQKLLRDTTVARNVKRWHDFTCQVCGVRLEGPAGPYAEAAHIRPLGAPHNGPDTESNMLCLCPNHHVLFDLGGLTLNDDLTVPGSSRSVTTVRQHQIDVNHVKYHRERYGVDADSALV